MAIFPPDAPNYTDPTFDHIMNYGSGTLLIPISLLSRFLNAVVFHVNLTQQKFGTATALFLVLALSDFLYTLVRVPYVTYYLLNPRAPPSVRNVQPITVQNLVAGVGSLTAYTSICAIFGISIMRFIKLGYPLWAISHRTATQVIAVVPMVVTVLYSVAIELALLCKAFKKKVWSNTAQDVLLGYDKLLLIRMWTVLAPTALSFFLALATVAKLYRDQQQSSQVNQYSMVTILLLSVGNITWSAQWSVTAALGENYFFNKTTRSIKGPAFLIFVFYVIMPSVIALYNPLVLCVRTSKMRATLRNLFRKLGFTTGLTDYQRIE